jgi:drug/metabolite transporter (DMT)-like permease
MASITSRHLVDPVLRVESMSFTARVRLPDDVHAPRGDNDSSHANSRSDAQSSSHLSFPRPLAGWTAFRMHALSRRQLVVLIALTLIWGINWPIMKAGITGFPPFTFRTISIWLGLPLLAGVLRLNGVSFAVPRSQWGELLRLGMTNMVVWQALIILALVSLSSGRAAILGYTMPIFSALIGARWFDTRLSPRGWSGVVAAAIGVMLLLWNELTNLSGHPGGVLLALGAAATWALGTQMLRRTRIGVPTLTVSFWMTALTALVMTILSVLFERPQWVEPGPVTWAAIFFNGVFIFALAQPGWFFLARGLPPLASSLSVMLIPVLGVFSGAWWLGEVLHWQDWTAVGLMVVSIATVLLPQGQARRPPR